MAAVSFYGLGSAIEALRINDKLISVTSYPGNGQLQNFGQFDDPLIEALPKKAISILRKILPKVNKNNEMRDAIALAKALGVRINDLFVAAEGEGR